MKSLQLYSLSSIPLIQEGDNIAQLILDSLEQEKIPLDNNDVIVIAQKIISKSEGAVINLSNIIASPEAQELANQTGRDERLCQLYLDEANEVIAVKGRMVITRHKLGYVGSSSGIDRSNIAPHSEEKVVLLPDDSDKSASQIRDFIKKATGKTIAVIINDSCGRDYRDGSVGMAIGISGITALKIENKKDLFGNPGKSKIAIVDEIAAAASILMGQSNEGIPVVIVKGALYTKSENTTIQEFIHK